MKIIISILLTLATIFPVAARRVLCDDNCKVEFTTTTDNEPRFAVVSPVGMPTVEMISQAPRLSTLEGKTIAIVGESFMTNIIHPEIAQLIAGHYPTAKVITVEHVGMAGVYPAPGITRRSKDQFQAKLKEYGVDAVITGNCGCGLCTQKECGSAIAAEYIGIPAVAATLATKYSTPEQLEQALIKTARRPTSERVFANYYANPGSNPEQRRTINQWQWHISNNEDSQFTPPPVWHATSDKTIATIPTMKRGMTAILITGDESRNKVQIMPGGGFTSRAVR